MLLIIIGALAGQLLLGTINAPDCKKLDFKPQACKTSELMSKVK